MIRTVEMDFQYQNYIAGPPISPRQLHNQACSNDEITVNTWRDTWINQTKANHEKHGSFKERGLGKYFKHYYQRPCIVVGSGPSLKNNIDDLKDTKGIPIISCLHNYHVLEDRGITPDFYVTLDAGPVTIEEIAEGGTKSVDEYFQSTKNKKLIAFIGSHPKLIEQWQGEVIWYNAPIPDQGIGDAIQSVEPFYTYVSTGGNVLGACFYIAKAIMGANPIIFVGADFSFSYNNKFHSYDSKYDKQVGDYMLATDVFGNRVKTWGSYHNFKSWFESRCCTVPGMYINATEGGILGSYPTGNIEQIKQMALSEVIRMFAICEEVSPGCLHPELANNTILF